MNEELLSYFWKLQRFRKENLCTTDGEPVSVIYPGLLNKDSGPDFLHARLRIGNTLWVGNVELHVKSSDWDKHGHSSDPNYENVILHVVYQSDMDLNLAVPELEMMPFLDQHSLLQAEDWQKSLDPIPCSSQLKTHPEYLNILWKERLLIERLEQKSERILEIVERHLGDWEASFFEIIAHYFGLKVNTLPFEMLARSIPLKLIRKYANNREEMEALFFGQAGMLENEARDGFHSSLKDRYHLQKTIHHLEPIALQHWKFLRLRPANFPTRRISQMATLFFQSPELFQELLSATQTKEMEALFRLAYHEYWEDHVRFGHPCKPVKNDLGAETIQLLLGNAVLPFLFVYAESRAIPDLREKTLEAFHHLRKEENKIIRLWKERKVVAASFGESQALLQLYTNYCSVKRCLDCQVGNRFLYPKQTIRHKAC